ncbi:hypothetical protein GWN26_00910 [Candidatus Saccharibacteria bacterium]|nr:hypothetical protein [Candidatus Saccharibacteria bacterium]
MDGKIQYLIWDEKNLQISAKIDNICFLCVYYVLVGWLFCVLIVADTVYGELE